jgi:DNA-binding response OmpR family regulator
MSKTVLSIGQCRPDHAAISYFLTSNFDVKVIDADLPDDAAAALLQYSVDLVLINRKLDADYSDGMIILRTLKSDIATADIPVMLVSNFPEWQEKAVLDGAVPGFGKAQLNSAETVERIRSILNLA